MNDFNVIVVSLGSYANSYEARAALSAYSYDDSWKASIVPIGIGLFRRDPISSNIHLTSSFSLVESKNILYDAGETMSRHMYDTSSFVLKEVEWACNFVIKNVYMGLIQFSIHAYGSHALRVALPTISDIDAVLQLKGVNSAITGAKAQRILETVASRLTSLHMESKIRLRSSNVHERRLQILTVKLSNEYPSLDLIVCCVDNLGRPIDKANEDSMNVLKDSALIKSSFNLSEHFNPEFERIICGAIRIVKVWANQRQIYGKKSGFLGGGGWTVLIIWILSNSKKEELSEIFNLTSVPTASKKVAAFFFKRVLSQWSDVSVVTLNNILANSAQNKFRDDVKRISNMNIMAPFSHGNFGRSSTQATTLTLKRELQKAKQLLDTKHVFDDSILTQYQHLGPLLLLLEIEIPSKSQYKKVKPSEVKAWGFTKQLSLIVDLEHILPPEWIRPTSHVVRKRRSFLFSLCFEGDNLDYENIKMQLEAFVNENKSQIEEEGKECFGVHAVVLSCVTNEDFKLKSNVDHPIH